MVSISAPSFHTHSQTRHLVATGLTFFTLFLSSSLSLNPSPRRCQAGQVAPAEEEAHEEPVRVRQRRGEAQAPPAPPKEPEGQDLHGVGEGRKAKASGGQEGVFAAQADSAGAEAAGDAEERPDADGRGGRAGGGGSIAAGATLGKGRHREGGEDVWGSGSGDGVRRLRARGAVQEGEEEGKQAAAGRMLLRRNVRRTGARTHNHKQIFRRRD